MRLLSPLPPSTLPRKSKSRCDVGGRILGASLGTGCSQTDAWGRREAQERRWGVNSQVRTGSHSENPSENRLEEAFASALFRWRCLHRESNRHELNCSRGRGSERDVDDKRLER